MARIYAAVTGALLRARDDESGQALVEYSLLLALIAIAAIAAVKTFGVDVSRLYQSVVDAYP